jgi:hypothetical protein
LTGGLIKVGIRLRRKRAIIVQIPAALHRVTLPGAQLHLFCFSDTDSGGFRMPLLQVSQHDLQTHLAGHWDIRNIELTQYTTALTSAHLDPARISALQAMGITINPHALHTDDQRRITTDVWHLHALRT